MCYWKKKKMNSEGKKLVWNDIVVQKCQYQAIVCWTVILCVKLIALKNDIKSDKSSNQGVLFRIACSETLHKVGQYSAVTSSLKQDSVALEIYKKFHNNFSKGTLFRFVSKVNKLTLQYQSPMQSRLLTQKINCCLFVWRRL